jgi:hypothetical protein
MIASAARAYKRVQSVAGTLDARMWIEEAVSHPPDKTAAADEFR